MKYFKAYGQLKDGSLFTCYQPDCMKHPILIGKKYTASEVQIPIEGYCEEDIQFYGLRTEKEVIPFMMDYVDKEAGFTEQEWRDTYTYPYTYAWPDREIKLEKLVIVECEGSPKDVETDYGEEMTFYDQTVLRIVREVSNEELWNKIHEILNKDN